MFTAGVTHKEEFTLSFRKDSLVTSRHSPRVMMMMLMIIPKMLLMMTVRAEMMMIKTGESVALECVGDWKYCEWKHHEKVSRDRQG